MSWYQVMQSKPATQKTYTPSTAGIYGGALRTIGSTSKSTSTTPKTNIYTAPKQPTVPQPVAQDNGGGGFGGGGYSPSWNFQMPGLPAEPKVTAALIKQWQERAKNEANLIYDPQVLAIQQELDKAILAASQSAGNIPGYYEDILSQIKQWQAEETENMQKRYFARGLGRGGGLVQEESKLAETALKEISTAETEKARKLSDIDAQKQLLTEQAGAKITGAETAEGQYVAARASELEDSYVQQKTALNQQKFQNQMAIQEFGLTAETQQFQNYLASTELALDIWKSNMDAKLAEEQNSISSKISSTISGDTNKNYGTGGVSKAMEAARKAADAVYQKKKNLSGLQAWQGETSSL